MKVSMIYFGWMSKRITHIAGMIRINTVFVLPVIVVLLEMPEVDIEQVSPAEFIVFPATT